MVIIPPQQPTTETLFRGANLKGSLVRPNTCWSPLGSAQQEPFCSLHTPYMYSDWMPDSTDHPDTQCYPVAPYMVEEGISPTALLAPVDLSQSNIEENQLKHIFWITQRCSDRWFSSLRPTAGDCPALLLVETKVIALPMAQKLCKRIAQPYDKAHRWNLVRWGIRNKSLIF